MKRSQPDASLERAVEELDLDERKLTILLYELHHMHESR
jgi:hypothetical protein